MSNLYSIAVVIPAPVYNALPPNLLRDVCVHTPHDAGYRLLTDTYTRQCWSRQRGLASYLSQRDPGTYLWFEVCHGYPSDDPVYAGELDEGEALLEAWGVQEAKEVHLRCEVDEDDELIFTGQQQVSPGSFRDDFWMNHGEDDICDAPRTVREALFSLQGVAPQTWQKVYEASGCEDDVECVLDAMMRQPVLHVAHSARCTKVRTPHHDVWLSIFEPGA